MAPHNPQDHTEVELASWGHPDHTEVERASLEHLEHTDKERASWVQLVGHMGWELVGHMGWVPEALAFLSHIEEAPSLGAL